MNKIYFVLILLLSACSVSIEEKYDELVKLSNMGGSKLSESSMKVVNYADEILSEDSLFRPEVYKFKYLALYNLEDYESIHIFLEDIRYMFSQEGIAILDAIAYSKQQQQNKVDSLLNPIIDRHKDFLIDSTGYKPKEFIPYIIALTIKGQNTQADAIVNKLLNNKIITNQESEIAKFTLADTNYYHIVFSNFKYLIGLGEQYSIYWQISQQ